MRERLERHHGEHEDDGESGQQDVQGDLVGGLLAAGALDQGDHAVEERLARLGGDLHHDPVGQHPGAAGDRRAVAAGLADDRGRLAGDGRLVDGGDALDDVAVAGDELSRRHHAQVAELELAGAAPRPRRRPRCTKATVSARVLRRVSAWALPRPSATASAKLAKSTVNHSQTTMLRAKTFSELEAEPKSRIR